MKKKGRLRGILKKKDTKKKKYSNKVVSLSKRLKDVRFDKSKLAYIKLDVSTESSYLENYLRRVSSRKFVNNEIRTFCGSVINVCHSLPEMIIRKSEITSRVMHHLKICKELETLVVICRSIVIMTKELRNEIYTIYRDQIFDQLVERVDYFTTSSDLDRIESVFETLYFGMKFLTKYMSEEMGVWFNKYGPLLCHKRVYIRKFTAQSFSMLIKSLDDQSRLETFLDSLIMKILEIDVEMKENTFQLRIFYDGLSWLLLETVETSLGEFHSSTKILFARLFQYLEHGSDKTTPEHHRSFTRRVYVMLEVTILKIVKYAKGRESLTPLWTIIGSEIEKEFGLFNDSQQQQSQRNVKMICSRISHLFGLFLVMSSNGRKKITHPIYEKTVQLLGENIPKLENLRKKSSIVRSSEKSMKDEEEEVRFFMSDSQFQVFLDVFEDMYANHRIEFCKKMHPTIFKLDLTFIQNLHGIHNIAKTILSRSHFAAERINSLKPIIETLTNHYVSKSNESDEESKAMNLQILSILLYIFERDYDGSNDLKLQFSRKYPQFLTGLINGMVSSTTSKQPPTVRTVLTMKLVRAFPPSQEEDFQQVGKTIEKIFVSCSNLDKEVKKVDDDEVENVNDLLLSETIFWFGEHLNKFDSSEIFQQSFEDVVLNHGGSLAILESLCFFLEHQTKKQKRIMLEVYKLFTSEKILRNLESSRTLVRRFTLKLLLLLHKNFSTSERMSDEEEEDFSASEIRISDIQDMDVMLSAILMSLIECEELGLTFEVFSKKVFLIRRIVDILRFGKSIILKELEEEEGGGKSYLILKILNHYILGGLYTKFQDFYPVLKNLGWTVQELWEGQASASEGGRRNSSFEDVWSVLFPELLKRMSAQYERIGEEQKISSKGRRKGTVFKPKRREEEEFGLIKNVDTIFDSRFKKTPEETLTELILWQKREEDDYLITSEKIYVDTLWDILYEKKTHSTKPDHFEFIFEDLVNLLRLLSTHHDLFKNLKKQRDFELERIESLLHIVNVSVASESKSSIKLQRFEGRLKPVLIKFLQVMKTKVQMLCLYLMMRMSDGKWISKYYKIIKKVMSSIGTFSITKISLFEGTGLLFQKKKRMIDEDDEEEEKKDRESNIKKKRQKKKYIELVIHLLLPHFQKQHKKERQKVWEIRIFNLLHFFWNNLGESKEELFFLLSKLLPEFSNLEEHMLESVEVYKSTFYLNLISEIFKLPSALILQHREVVERLQNVLLCYVMYDLYFFRTNVKKTSKMRDEDDEEEVEGEDEDEKKTVISTTTTEVKNKYESQIKQAIELLSGFSRKFQDYEYSEAYVRKNSGIWSEYLENFKNHFGFFKSSDDGNIIFPEFFEIIFQWMTEPHLIAIFTHPNVKNVLGEVLELIVFLADKNVSLRDTKNTQQDCTDTLMLISRIFGLMERMSQLKDYNLPLHAVQRIYKSMSDMKYVQQFENKKISFVVSEYVNVILNQVHELKNKSSKLFFPISRGKKKKKKKKWMSKKKRGGGWTNSSSSSESNTLNFSTSNQLAKECFRIVDLFNPFFRDDSPCDLILSFYGSSFSLTQPLRETRAERVIQAFQRYIPRATRSVQMKYVSNLSYMFVHQKDMTFRRKLCDIFEALAAKEREENNMNLSSTTTSTSTPRRRKKRRRLGFDLVSKVLIGMNSQKKETLSRMDYSELLEQLKFLSNKTLVQERFFPTSSSEQENDSIDQQENTTTAPKRVMMIDDYALLPVVGNLFFFQKRKELDVQSLSSESMMVVIEHLSNSSSLFPNSVKFVLDNLFNSIKSKEILYRCEGCETMSKILERGYFEQQTSQYNDFIDFFKLISQRGESNKIQCFKNLQSLIEEKKKKKSEQQQQQEKTKKKKKKKKNDLDRMMMELFFPMTLVFFRVPIHEDIAVETLLCLLKNLNWSNFKKMFVQFLNPLKTSKHFSSIICGRNIRVVNGMIDHFINSPDEEFVKNNLVFGFFIHQVLHTLVTSPQLPNLLQLKDVGISKLLKYVPNVNKLRSHVSSVVKVLCQQMMKGKESSSVAKKVIMDLMMEIGITHFNYVLKILRDLMKQGRHEVTRNYVIHSILKKYSMEFRRLGGKNRNRNNNTTTELLEKQKQKEQQRQRRMKDEDEVEEFKDKEEPEEEESELARRTQNFNVCVPLLLEMILKQISIENNENLKRDRRNFEVLSNTFKHIGVCIEMSFIEDDDDLSMNKKKKKNILVEILEILEKTIQANYKKDRFLKYIKECLESFSHGVVLNPTMMKQEEEEEEEEDHHCQLFSILEGQFRRFRIFKKQFRQYFDETSKMRKVKEDPMLVQLNPKDDDFEDTFLESANPTNRLLVAFILSTISLHLTNLPLTDTSHMQLSVPFVNSITRFLGNPSQSASLAFESIHLLTRLLARSHPFFEDQKNVDNLLQHVFILVGLCGMETSSSHYGHLFSALLCILQHPHSPALSQEQWEGILTLLQQDLGDLQSSHLNLQAFLILKEMVCKIRLQHAKIYKLMYTIRQLLLTIQNQGVVEVCRTILLEFLHHYRMSESVLNDHLEFLIKQLINPNLSNENRIYLLEAFETMFSKFPYAFITQKLDIFFIPLTLQYVRSEDHFLSTSSSSSRTTIQKYESILIRILQSLRSEEFYELVFKKYIYVWLTDRTGKCKIVGVMMLPLFIQAKPEDAFRIISTHKSQIWNLLTSFIFISSKKKEEQQQQEKKSRGRDDVEIIHYLKLWNKLLILKNSDRKKIWDWKFVLNESNGWSLLTSLEYMSHEWSEVRIQILQFFDILFMSSKNITSSESSITEGMIEFMKLFQFEKITTTTTTTRDNNDNKYHFRNIMIQMFQTLVSDLLSVDKLRRMTAAHTTLLSKNLYHVLSCMMHCIHTKKFKKFERGVMSFLSELHEKTVIFLEGSMKIIDDLKKKKKMKKSNKKKKKRAETAENFEIGIRSMLEMVDMKVNSVLKIYIKFTNSFLKDRRDSLKMYVPYMIPLLFTILENPKFVHFFQPLSLLEHEHEEQEENEENNSSTTKSTFVDHSKEVVEFIRNSVGNEEFVGLYNEERTKQEKVRIEKESKIAELAISDPKEFAKIQLLEERKMKDEEEGEEEVDKSIILRNMKRKREVYEDDDDDRKKKELVEKDDDDEDKPSKKKRKIMKEEEEEEEGED